MALLYFYFCVFMDLDFVSGHNNTHTMKNLGQYQALVTSGWVNKQ